LIKLSRALFSALIVTLLVLAGMQSASAASTNFGDSSDPVVVQNQAIAQGNFEHSENAPPSTATLPAPAPKPGQVVPFTQSIGGAICTGTMDAPHFSNGANGAIFKVRVSCVGTAYPTVSVRVRGALSLSVASCPTCTPGPITTRATSDKTQTVVVGGGEVTFYVPDVGSSGGYGTGFWYYTHTIQIVGPQTGNVGSSTDVVWKSFT